MQKTYSVSSLNCFHSISKYVDLGHRLVGGINMNKKRIIYTISFITILIVFLLFNYYTLNFSNEGILENVINKHGYSVNIKKEQVLIEVYIKPEWITFEPDEKKNLNVKVLEINNTNITLDNVWNRGNDIYFSFHTTTNMKYSSGEFLYNVVLNEDGTFTQPSPGKILIYDENHKNIPVGQTGYGPGGDFSFGIQPENQINIKNGFYVNYTGYILYEYIKK